ncbi:MAG: urease accessory protein UreF [Betaproteobacteria bacterium]|nr:urease accessory protein UreF [Betaproteobacteria bacterium]
MASDLLGLTRLLQLASPTLPVGAYSYSQGLEYAIEDRIVTDAVTAERWIRDVLEFSVGSFELPLLSRMLDSLADGDDAAFLKWNALFRAGRETAELRAETLQMGHALTTLLRDLAICNLEKLAALQSKGALTLPAAYAIAADAMKIEHESTLTGYVWSWLENQVMAALKAVPLGQSAGQRMLMGIGAGLPATVQRAIRLDDDELTNFAPGLAIASSRHETQYSRLFRS